MSAPDTHPTPRSLVEHRFVIGCQTRTPLHTGSGLPGSQTDAELRRNARGKLVIPGTSIAGVLRNAVERLAGVRDHCLLYQPEFRNRRDSSPEPCGCAVCKLFGNVRPNQDARPSRVTVLDAVLDGPPTRVVDGVAISRSRRAAQDARKFDYRQILPGCAVRIEVLAESLSQQEQQWLGAALRMLATGQVGLGGRTARGHGILEPRPADCRIFRRDLNDPDQLLACVAAENSNELAWGPAIVKALDKFPGDDLRLAQRIGAAFCMAPVAHGTFLIADPVRAAATGFDHGQRKRGGKVEIPVSSLVGVLRSGAERIVRTLGGRACDPLGADLKRCQPGSDKDQIVVDDSWCCPVCQIFGNQDWASRLSATVTSLGGSRNMPFDHVAIDRFTGGAADQKKFDALAATGGMFQVQLTVDRVPDRETASWIIGLLALVLRDLHQGRLWLGHGGSRGHGLMQLAGEPVWNLPAEWDGVADKLQACVAALLEHLTGEKAK